MGKEEQHVFDYQQGIQDLELRDNILNRHLPWIYKTSRSVLRRYGKGDNHGLEPEDAEILGAMGFLKNQITKPLP